MKDVLVIYFSRSGHTRRVAEYLARALGADCEPIRERRSRKGFLGYWRSAHEGLRSIAIDIEPGFHEPRDYRLIVIGSPVWASHVCSPVRAYIARHKRDLTSVALFCTQGGSGAPKVLRAMAALCGRTPLATAFFNDRDIDGSGLAARLDAFVGALTARKAA